MKNKKLLLAGIAVALVLGIGLLISHLLRLDIKAEDDGDVFKQESTDDAGWQSVKEGEIVLENDAIRLTMNAQTTHFTVTDKESNSTYASVPQQTDGFEPKEEQSSEVMITYYDANSVMMLMNSYENSIQNESFEVKTDGDAIRVYYSIQKSKQTIFVPTIISQETFENVLLANLETGPKRRLKGFYNLNEEEKYYELSDSAGEHNYSEITGYMETAGYTQEMYAKEAEELGVDSSVSENSPAAFVIPVEYTLTEQGMKASILTDKITSASANYHLTNIQLLPYFGSCGYSKDGWMLVPDGSGAIIDLEEKSAGTYSQQIYGADQAVESSVKSTIMQNAGLPVFALHNGDHAFFAEITGAKATATVNAETFGNEITQSHIYTDFNVQAFDSSDMGALRNQAAFNLYAKEYVAEFPEVTYTLFGERSTTYSDMANTYREQLIARGVLNERLTETQALPVYLDFTGYETTDESFLGISVDGQEVFSTIEEIEEALEELEKRGVSGINVRLRSYGNGGIYNQVENGFDLQKQVGSVKELKELAERLNGKGQKLYLENNISTVYETGGSFKKMTHAVRSLRKTVVEAFDYDLVARVKAEAEMEYYLVSPAYYRSLVENFFTTMEKSCKSTDLFGYSWSDYGSKLYSDFHQSTVYDRTQAEHAATEAVKAAKEYTKDVITDGSNSYVLSEASAMLNIPLRSSALSCESYSVPFYQMVVHGYKDYAGAPMNTGGDLDGNYLASIESGACLYYTFYTSGEEPLKTTQAGSLIYPTDVTASYATVEAQYQEFEEVFKNLRTQTIRSHERVADRVFVTTYEDGTRVAVNYNDSDATIGSRTIPAQGFSVWKGVEQ